MLKILVNLKIILIQIWFDKMENIDKIIYINLDSRVDRRRHMEKMLSKINIPYKRFNAVKPGINDILRRGGRYNLFFKKSHERVKRFCEDDNAKYRGAGIIGCYVSHYNILKAHRNGHLLVLEDDAEFDRVFLEKLDRRISKELSGTSWDMVRVVWPYVSSSLRRHGEIGEVVSPSFVRWANHVGRMYVDQDLLPNKNRYNHKKNRSKSMDGGTTFQIINKNSVEKILDALDEEPLNNIDGVYSKCLINSYIYSPSNRLESFDVLTKNNSILKSDIPKVSVK